MRIAIFLLLLLSQHLVHSEELDSTQVATLLDQLAKKRAGTSAIQTDFHEEKRMPMMKNPVFQTGIMAFLAPDKFRREIKGETPSLTICDGTTLWIYYPLFQEAEKYPLAGQKMMRDAFAAMAATFQPENLSGLYKVKAEKSSDGYFLTLEPKKSSLKRFLTSAVITLNGELQVVKTKMSTPAGDEITTTFSNEKPSSLRTKDFQFEPPVGTSISEPLGR